MIPLCSHATKDLELENCKTFKPSPIKLQSEHCFTFNETSLKPKVGLTQGLNFILSFAYPGAFIEKNQPASIILHEPGTVPDVQNIKGKNFHVKPGSVYHLKISPTVIESTTEFDSMSLKKRGCDNVKGYGDIHCIYDYMFQMATSRCDCVPRYYRYMNESKISCNITGMFCFEESLEHAIGDLQLQEKCHQPCKEVMYSLNEAEKLPMTDTLLNLDSYGLHYEEYFLRFKGLNDYFESYLTREDFLKSRMQRTSLVHINFEESKVWTMTKDAKITLPDMIGNIGGTLGVFVGFSFLGLLDMIIELMSFLKRQK